MMRRIRALRADMGLKASLAVVAQLLRFPRLALIHPNTRSTPGRRSTVFGAAMSSVEAGFL
jgi:hypothetical protein